MTTPACPQLLITPNDFECCTFEVEFSSTEVLLLLFVIMSIYSDKH